MEQWKTHPTTGLQVSTEGRVITRRKGVHRGNQNGGYMRIRRNGKNWKVHRMVAETFIPNPENKPQVNHINGNKTDNRVENLEWATAAENNQHAFDSGLKVGFKGEAHHKSRFTEAQVREIRQNAQGLSQRALARLYGVTGTAIYLIVNRKTWQHI